jgi:periplasmic protein TonB
MPYVAYRLIIFSSLCFPIGSFAQEERIYTVSEINTRPQPVKGLNAFYKQWSDGVVYPDVAVQKKVTGLVFIQFVVDKEGTISEVAIKQGLGHGCDEAALQGFREATKKKWKPAIRSGKAVSVKMVLPFSFRVIERSYDR